VQDGCEARRRAAVHSAEKLIRHTWSSDRAVTGRQADNREPARSHATTCRCTFFDHEAEQCPVPTRRLFLQCDRLDRLSTHHSLSLGPVTCVHHRSSRFLLTPARGVEAAPGQPFVFKIPSLPYSSRRPANIPLHTLSSSSTRQRDGDSAHLLNDHDKESPRSSFDTPDSDSDLSLWSDTGDLVDQLADQEDPLRIRLRESLDGYPSKNRGRQPKRVRYQSQDGADEKPAGSRKLRKEDIEIPNPGPQTISKAERIIAQIMAPNDGPSRIHGLHGKKLMWVTPCHDQALYTDPVAVTLPASSYH